MSNTKIINEIRLTTVKLNSLLQSAKGYNLYFSLSGGLDLYDNLKILEKIVFEFAKISSYYKPIQEKEYYNEMDMPNL